MFGSSRRYADNPLSFVTAVERAYNGIAAFDMGPIETYMVTDPKGIEQVLVGESASFPKPDFQADMLGELLGDGLLLSDGDDWAQQRKRATPAFSMARLAAFDERIASHAVGLVSEWSDGDSRDIETEMTDVTLDVITDLMLGTELTGGQRAQLRQNLEPIGEQFEPDPIRFALPSWAPTPGERAFNAAVDAVDEIVAEIIATRRGTATDTEKMDLLSVLLRAQQQGEQSDEQLRDEVATTLLAGHDTTALTLTYTWYLLSEHPEKRAKVEAEADAVDGTPTMDDVEEFEYIEWVIREAMRLYPPVYSMLRDTAGTVELLGYEIPDGSMVMLPQWAVHRSPTYWEKPAQFIPERWEPPKRGNRPRFAYFPFGGGPRHCIGKYLAELEAKLIVAVIANRFELSYEGDSPPELQPSLTLHPKTGMEMTVTER